MKKRILILILVILAFVSAVFLWVQKSAKKESIDQENFVKINGYELKTEISATPEKQEMGLSGRKSLCENCSMLFVFSHQDKYSFWMKDMQFDLDMLWIDGEKIVQIDRNVSHTGGTREMRTADVPVDKVLEVNAGISDKLGFKAGDLLELDR